MQQTALTSLLAAALLMSGCDGRDGGAAWLPAASPPVSEGAGEPPGAPPAVEPVTPTAPEILEPIDGIAAIRLPVPAWNRLTPRQRILAWHLAQAMEDGRQDAADPGAAALEAGAAAARPTPTPAGATAIPASLLERTARHLEEAATYADPPQASALREQATALRSGAAPDQQAADLAWLSFPDPVVDVIPGFGALAEKPHRSDGVFLAVVHTADRDSEAASIMATLAAEAPYFEAHAPWDDAFRRIDPGPSASFLAQVVAIGGSGLLLDDGVSLPGDDGLRRRGSRSYLFGNVMQARWAASAAGLQEFILPEELEEARRHGWRAALLLACLHQALGHVSGADSSGPNPGAAGIPPGDLAALEEARADLVALHHIWDPRLAELGLSTGPAVAAASYRAYARRALTQLRRRRDGASPADESMHATDLIVGFLLDSGVVRLVAQNGRRYYQVSSLVQMRHNVAAMLGELMRIKATGDAVSARRLLARYAESFDPDLRDEVVRRAAAAGLPDGFAAVLPAMEPVRDESGAVVDIRLVKSEDSPMQPSRQPAGSGGDEAL